MSRLWVHGPNLFIVGAPKCGTTSMAAYLGRHPDIYFAERKEPFFFCTDLPHTNAVTDEQTYLSLFANGTDQRYRGEGSTWYLYSTRAAAAIKAVSSEARIIIMLRDPIDLIVSQFQYNLLNGNENLHTVEAALEAEPARLEGKSIPPSNRIAAALHYTALVDFAPQVERYWQQFGKERVHIILFDELAKEAAATLRETLDFLQLPWMPNIDLKPENETGKLTERRFSWLYRAMLTKKGLMGRAKRHLPRPIKDVVWRSVDGLNRAAGDRPAKPTLSPACRTALAKRLRPGIDRLAVMLDCDLTHWARPDQLVSDEATAGDAAA
ncbi:MAG: sulfotransferase family protein [Geminicoccaceae bacterium]